MSDGLSAGQVNTLTSLVVEQLRACELAAPLEDESEPAYTVRQLQNPMQRIVDDLRIAGLVTAGGGAGQIRPVYMLGLHFYPDLTITYWKAPVLAVEVKYLRPGQRQGSLATAVGQATIYRESGYRRAIVFVLDLANRVSNREVADARKEFEGTGFLELIVRRIVGSVVEPDVA